MYISIYKEMYIYPYTRCSARRMNNEVWKNFNYGIPYSVPPSNYGLLIYTHTRIGSFRDRDPGSKNGIFIYLSIHSKHCEEDAEVSSLSFFFPISLFA